MENNHSIKIRAELSPMGFGRKINLYYMEQLGEKYSAADQLCMREMVDEESVPSFARIDKEQAQVLMDDLWNCGLRPSEGSGSAGAMMAVQKHLADMKKILFHSLKIEE